MEIKINRQKRFQRHKRVRAKIYGTAVQPRLCVFRSARHIHAQLINDEAGTTLAAASDLEFEKMKTKKKKEPTLTISSSQPEKEKQKEWERKKTIAYEVGKLIAKKAKRLKIERVVFDRSGYKYHGRIKALHEGAKEGGLKF